MTLHLERRRIVRKIDEQITRTHTNSTHFTKETYKMSGPIVRSGPTPEYSSNWDKVFEKKKSAKKKAAATTTSNKIAKKKKKS